MTSDQSQTNPLQKIVVEKQARLDAMGQALIAHRADGLRLKKLQDAIELEGDGCEACVMVFYDDGKYRIALDGAPGEMGSGDTLAEAIDAMEKHDA